jgi:CHAT domain-containing protein
MPLPPGVSRSRAAFIEDLGPDRPTEARLRGMPFAPWQLAAGAPEFDEQLAIRTREIESQATGPSPKALVDLALVRLVARRPAESVTLLERATANAAGAASLSDLGAAYLARGVSEKRPGDFIASLDALDRAVELAPRLPEARFNLALALEKNLLRDQAIAAWNDYLAIETDTSWHEEGRRLLARISAPRRADSWAAASAALERFPVAAAALDELLHDFPDRVRKVAEEELFTRWAHEFAAGQIDDAAETLRLLRQIGTHLGDRGEWMVLDTVQSIDRLSAGAGNREIAGLAQSLGALSLGRGSCLINEGASGAELLRRARRDLDAAGVPLGSWAQFHLAVCSYQRSEFATALALLESLRSAADAGRYPSLIARSWWMTGLVLSSQGDPSPALRAYREGSRIAREARSIEDAAALDILTSETLRFIGQQQEALELLYKGAAPLIDGKDLRRTYTAFDDLRQIAVDLRRPRAASRFADQLVATATESPDAAGIAHAFLRRGEVQLSLGRRGEALADFGRAETACRGIADERSRQRRMVDVLIARGTAHGAADAPRALDDLAKAIETLDTLGDAYRVIDAYTARARLYAELSDPRSADRDLRDALAELSRQRSNIDDRQKRLEFLDGSRQLFDELLAAAVRAGDSEEQQLEIVEAKHSQALMEMAGLPAAGASRRSTSETLRRLPAGVAVVEYAVLADRVKIWLLAAGRIEVETSPISKSDLDDLIDAAGREMRRGGSGTELNRVLERLYAVLMAPIAAHLRPGDALVVVPDRRLRSVPFAALRDPRTGRHLVESRAISAAPSAALFAALGPSSPSSPCATALVLGNPRFDQALFPRLADLPGAATEARRVAAVYGSRASLRLELQATPAALVTGLNDYDVLHVASHALPNEEHPLLASLVLAPNRGSSGVLFSRDLFPLRGTRTELAVLSACRTAAGRDAGGGTLGLVDSFLAAGVPRVVATLWDIDDTAGAEFFPHFHTHLAAGATAGVALRQTQRAMMRSADPRFRRPAAWAGFALYEASTAVH